MLYLTFRIAAAIWLPQIDSDILVIAPVVVWPGFLFFSIENSAIIVIARSVLARPPCILIESIKL